jgi:Protein of unknown function (DUF2442)
MMHFVEKLLSAQPYRLTLRFNTGEVRAVDLEAFLRAKAAAPGSAYRSLLDPQTFCRARLDAESRTVCWDGLAREITGEGAAQPAPLDLCPDVLYSLSTPQAPDSAESTTRQEAAAESLILHDERPRPKLGTPKRR